MDIADLLGPEGPLARQIPGFAPRLPQQRMARAVDATLEEGGLLIVEAGTGTGKTFAYLAPALLSGARVLISTGTRHLQDQLYHQDLPVVRRALKSRARVALLKGRGNYLCRYRLHLLEQEGRLASRAHVVELQHIRRWASRTQCGDIAEIADLPENSPLWPRVTSTADNCLGPDCPWIEECFFAKARLEALAADVLVINHYLFCADLALRETGFAELLPGVEAVIFDEAHQLPDIATHFFGRSLSGRQLTELARDTLVEQARDAADFPELRFRAEALAAVEAVVRTALGTVERRALWREVADQPAVQEAISQLTEALERLREALKEAAQRGKGLESCRRRAEDLKQRLALTTGEERHSDAVCWFETRGWGFTLSRTPLNIAPTFRTRLEAQPGARIFTSATLAVGESFEHFAARLGLQDYAALRLDSPFDFARNTLLYHPPGLPEPASPQYTPALLEAALPVLQASRGRAFLLFTSYRALREAEAGLAGRLAYPLLVQGAAPKAALLREFRALGNAVLLGTASFWEGVDVRGEALSCVIIDRLPFASPGDPVVQARIESLRQRGEDPFRDYQLPQAVIALKQGVGRLIRDVSDRGVLMLCDPRLLTKFYGRAFLDSLPPMPRTRKLERVQAFFAGACNRPERGGA
ncbi:MAG TPA: ATP-dependent DNA helicase [Candidatus Contendobacter sp.]|nr:ATP-dependent DNA helicase [Candidatus Contendobacter sp.]HRZ22914.1 ATP-dependent DNA helicase [Candidatus Contendobacter sp.]HRZ51830.1 ATP-dependent DNA helicase [Candidatus Contendobacter sp.]